MKTFASAAALALPAQRRSWWRQSLQRVRRWRRRAEERRALAAMSMRDLRDIGLTPLDAWREANKPFWRA